MKILVSILAVAPTVTAASLSIMAGWQRGGFLAERVLWIAVGVVLVVAAHLLPALVRTHGRGVRAVGALLWIGCIAATCYGHAVFFLMAQKHAGELRAAAVPAVTAKGRGLAEIARDRADAVTRLARTNARRCVAPCSNLIAERAAALADPVTGALTAFGVTAPRAELVTGLAFAGVLEAVACFSWLLALRPANVTQTDVTPVAQGGHAESVMPVMAASNGNAPVLTPVTEPVPVLQMPVIKQADDVTRVRAAIAADELRATVTEIRKFLGCSQATAAAVRKQVSKGCPSNPEATSP